MAERFTRFATRKKIPQLLPKINARTGGIQVDGRHLLFGEYLQKYAPLSPERAEKQANEGGNYFKDFGEFHPPCPYRPQRIKSSTTCKILQITLSLI